MEIQGYGNHVANNLYFKRENNGFVTITQLNENNAVVYQQTVTDVIWASVVAGVSYFGEDAETRREAFEFHNKTLR